MIRVRQLCGGGLYRDVPYWTETMWCGVTLARCWFWLTHHGWGPYISRVPPADVYDKARLPAETWRFLEACGRQTGWSCIGPLRLRGRGRCWIEDRERPAVAYIDGEEHPGILPPLEQPAPFVPSPRRRGRRAIV